MRDVKERADENVIGFFCVENIVGLELKAPVVGGEFVGGNSHARELGKQPENAFESCVVGVSLVCAELCFGVIVNDAQILLGAWRENKFSRCGGRQRALAPLRVCLPSLPCSLFGSPACSG